MNKLLLNAFQDAQVSLEGRSTRSAITDDAYSTEVLKIVDATVAMENAATVEDELNYIVAGLEAIASELDACDEGITRQSAQFMKLAVESHTARLGMSAAPIASMESFGGMTDSLEASKDSKTGISGAISKVLKVIADAFKKGWRKVSEFFSSLFSGVGAVTKRLEALKTATEKLKGLKNDKKDKFSPSGLPRVADIDGKVDGAKLKAGISELTTQLAATFTGMTDGAEIIYSAKLTSTLSMLEGEDADTRKDAVEAAIAEAQVKLLDQYSDFKGDGKPLMGGKVLRLANEESEEKAAYPVLESDENYEKPSETEEISAISKSDVTDILDEAIKLAAAIKAGEKSLKSFSKDKEKGIKKIDKVVKDADKGVFVSTYAKAKMKFIVKFMGTGVDKAATKTSSHAFQVLRSTISIIEANNVLYTTKEPKGDKAGEEAKGDEAKGDEAKGDEAKGEEK